MKPKDKKIHKEFNDILTQFNKDIKNGENVSIYNTLQQLFSNLDKRVVIQTKGLDAKYYLGKKEGVALGIYLFDKLKAENFVELFQTYNNKGE